MCPIRGMAVGQGARAAWRHGSPCCTFSPCCRRRSGLRAVSCRTCGGAGLGPRGGASCGCERPSPPECRGPARLRSEVSNQQSPVEVHAACGLAGKIQPGRFGSGSLPGDVVLRRTGRARLEHRLLATGRNDGARLRQTVERTGQQIASSGQKLRDARELQDVRSGEVASRPVSPFVRLTSLLPNWLSW